MSDSQQPAIQTKTYHNAMRFPGRGGQGWKGPLVDYKEVEMLRRFLSTSCKVLSRRRAGTNSQEQRDLKVALKRARFLALLPYTSGQ
jgi:ribosomal protein S18